MQTLRQSLVVSELPRLTILYGTQTGTCEGFAKIVFSFAKARGFDKVTLCRMDQYDTSKLHDEDVVILMTSTFYNGEFPDNALALWKFLDMSEEATSRAKGKSLSNVRFAVFGLGNKKNAENFNRAARNLDARMADLGATRLLPLGLGDEYDPNGHESAFRPWIKALWSSLGVSSARMGLPVRARVEQVTGPQATQGAVTGATCPPDYKTVRIVSNELLTPPGYDREVHVVTFEGAGPYSLLDHILIQPQNPIDLVRRCAARLRLDLDQVVRVSGESVDVPPLVSVRALLEHYVDIGNVANRTFLEGMAAMATDRKQAEELDSLASDMLPGNQYAKISQKDIFSVVDALERFPSVPVTLSHLVSNVPTVVPRYYSICSSPLVAPSRPQVCFVLDTWTSPISGRVFKGLASNHLANLPPGSHVFGKISKGVLVLPEDPATPLVGVALGSGIGVLRGIVSDREAKRRGGGAVSKVLLYYGIRHRDKDYVFKDDLERWQRDGLVDVVLSCSHDQKEFITPATRVLEDVSRVARVFDDGGTYVYCGLGGSVPGIIEDAVRDALCEHRHVSDYIASEYVTQLKGKDRFLVEAYLKDADVENWLKEVSIRKGGRAEVEEAVPVAAQNANAKMFCFQCEQTFLGKGCTTVGVCGKSPELSAMMDLLVHRLKVLSWFLHHTRLVQVRIAADATLQGVDKSVLEEDAEANRFSLEGMFATLTNVNFDTARFVGYNTRVKELTRRAKGRYEEACRAVGEKPKVCPVAVEVNGETEGMGAQDMEDLFVRKGREVGVLGRFKSTKNDALVGLQEMLVYGLKGVCAYADHAYMFKYENAKIYEFLHEALAFLLGREARDVDKVLGMLMRCGECNLTTMDLLHNANATLGTQSPTQVPIKPVAGKCILVSGHDLMLLEQLVQQCSGKAVNVYTHGEMLPAHGYPKLRAYNNLVAHFGVGWQRQGVEFPHFPGSILMTTNCLTPPKDDYRGRLFTAGAVGWPHIPHVPGTDFAAVINRAMELPGFAETDREFSYGVVTAFPRVGSYSVGFGSETVISVADKVLEAVKKGDITRFYVIGGCDGYEGERSYFTDLARNLPPTSVVLTAGCGKYRVNHLEYATIGDTGIPRLLDMGQCNDSYSAVLIASALSKALNCTVHDLPVSIALSWFEQKAVAVLLSLLSLGLKNIRVGPQLPAFLRPSIVSVLNQKFGLMLVGDPHEDLKNMLAGC